MVPINYFTTHTNIFYVMDEKQTLWSRLKAGKLPEMDVNTIVEFDSESLVYAGIIILLIMILLFTSFFAIKKQLA